MQHTPINSRILPPVLTPQGRNSLLPNMNQSLIDLEREDLEAAFANLNNNQVQNGQVHSTVANVDPPTIHHCRLSQFSRAQPQLWFYQAESVFQTYNVTTDADKFHLVISRLTPDVLQEIPDILQEPPQADKYLFLKEQLLKRLTDSPDRQLEKALSEVQLGQQKPSQLLRQMQLLSNGLASEDTLRVKWLSLLPPDVRKILKITKTLPLKDLAVAADDLMEEATSATVMAASTYVRYPNRPSPDPVTSELAELRQAMSQLIAVNRTLVDSIERMHIGHTSQGRGARSRSRSSSAARAASPASRGMCFYHVRFGDKARNCFQPCNYEASASANLQQQGN